MQCLGISQLVAPGSIMSYIGNSDPEGWIICDGELRTATDNRYNALAAILGGTGNSITPPNLKSKFLYGSDNTASIMSGGNIRTGGSSTVTLTKSNIPKHSHTININDSGHKHTTTAAVDNHSHSSSTVTDSGHTHINTMSYTGGTHSHIDCPIGKGYIDTDDNNWSGENNQYPPADDGKKFADPINSDSKAWLTNIPSSYLTVTTVTESTGVSLTADTKIKDSIIPTITNPTTATNITASCANFGSDSPISIIPDCVIVNYIMKY